MTKTPKLNDLQLILLATAVQREGGSILPPPDSVGDQAERIGKAIPGLLRRGLISEVPVTDQNRAWREDDQQAIGLVITDAGRAIIAAEEPGDEGPHAATPATATSGTRANIAAPAAPRAASKIETVIGLLCRSEGATLAAMIEATGWLPHSTRAALTGLRKKGYQLTKASRDGITVYHIAQD